MANISWTSNSINSFLTTSLGSQSSPFSGIYQSLSDASLIRSGSYSKMMKSYYSSLKESDSSSSSEKDTTTTTTSRKHANANQYTYDSTEKTTSEISNKVLDDLLNKEEKKSTITNGVLDELLGKKTETAYTYNSSAQKTAADSGSVLDEQA